MIKTLATAIALILTLSIATTAFAQGQNATSGATGLQIQIVPQIQRGHQQHLTIFSVDDQGNQINASEIQSTITNEKGNLVGPKTLYTNSGEDVAYKVGPNTRPQNITVDSCLTEQDLCATQSYYVFPKGQAQIPEPLPPILPEPELPEANNTGEGEVIVPENETDVTTPEGGNETLPEQPVPDLPPAENETAPPVVNETIPIEPVPPVANETVPSGNETTEPTPEPAPPVSNETIPSGNETVPIEGNVTIPVENETASPIVCIQAPCDPETGEPFPPSTENGTIPSGNETVPIEGNVTIPTTNQTQNTTVEPEPLPPTENGGGQTPNGTTPTNGNETAPPTEPEPQLNATEAFTQLENTTAILDEKLNEVIDTGDETARGELKALLGDTSGAIGDISEVVVNATNDQLLILQGSSISISDSIDEILVADDTEAEGEGEDEQGEDEQ